MSSVALLLVRADVSESEPGEAVRAGRARVGGVDREQDNPREEPDREEDLDDHAQEEQVAVGIRTVLLEHLLGVGVPEGERPAQEGGRHGRRALRLILGYERPRLVDGSEVASNEGEGNNLDSCDGGVEDEGRHKGLGRGRRSVSAGRKEASARHPPESRLASLETQMQKDSLGIAVGIRTPSRDVERDE